MAGRPADAGSAEAAFRANLRDTVTLWRRRLAASSDTTEAAGIGSEAAQLRSIAESHAWWPIAQHLGNVETLSRESPVALAGALEALVARLAPAVDPARQAAGPAPVPPPPMVLAAGGEIALPPMLDEFGVPSQIAGGSRIPGVDATLASASHLANPVGNGPGGREVHEGRREAPRSPLPAAAPKAPVMPKLIAKNLLGLRAFGREKSSPQDPPGAGGGLLGLKKRPFESARSSAPVPVFSPRAPRRLAGSSVSDRVAAPRPARSSATPSRRAAGEPSPLRKRMSAVPSWFYLLSGLIALMAVATVGVVCVLGRTAEPVAKAPVPLAHSDKPTVAPSPAPSPIGEVTEVIHQHGQETPELRALIDQQSRLAANCRDDSSSCGRGWTANARHAVAPIDPGALARSPATPSGPPSSWLLRLKLPKDFPLRDDPILKGSFEYDTKNIAGRQMFQAKFFQCSAYADIFEGTLMKYGAPQWLAAVVYQESGCDPLAASEVGAKGLWQFMPESARAYGLRVVDDEVDERLNAVKSTEAAIHFLADLYRKLGSWDLALAAYNMGPFGLMARIARTGTQAGFWDLERAGLLPDETAGYVPAIEAYALHFSRDGKRLESTAEIAVSPGSRLSLIARVAHTSTLRIRELNREFLRDFVPQGESTVRVPDSEAHRAQDVLRTMPQDDKTDLCVPEDFDWGTTVFETSRYGKSCGRAGPR